MFSLQIASKIGISGTPAREEQWNFDPTGNWHGSSTAYLVKESGNTTLDQNRQHNVANEITDISHTTGDPWPNPQHDAAGNLVKVPPPLSLSDGYDLKWDAWNRLVEVKNPPGLGGNVVATYQYDGEHRRITNETAEETRHYFYSDQWQVIEERVDDESSPERRYVWGARSEDDLVAREVEDGGSGSSSSSGGLERLYALSDAMSSVTAIVDDSGDVLERYGYAGFGAPRYLTPSFGTRTASLYEWETLFDGYRYDRETGLYHVRYRYLHPNLGRWLSRDPIGEEDGINLYAFVGNNSPNSSDAMGLSSEKINCHEVSIAVSGSFYKMFGGGASISISGEMCDCCDPSTGDISRSDTWNVTARIKGRVGVGFGGHVRILGYYISPGKILGPQVELINLSGGYRKGCGEEGHAFLRSEKAIDISVTGAAAIKGFGITLTAGLRGYVGVDVEFHGNRWDSYLFWGYTASGSVTAHLRFFSYTKTWYWDGNEDRTLIRSGQIG